MLYEVITNSTEGGCRIQNTYEEELSYVITSYSIHYTKLYDMAYNFSISNIRTSAAVVPTIFSFDVPANAQVVKNPLDIQ